MRCWIVRYGSTTVTRAITKRGALRRAQRWLSAPENAVRRPRLGNLQIQRKAAA